MRKIISSLAYFLFVLTFVIGFHNPSTCWLRAYRGGGLWALSTLTTKSTSTKFSSSGKVRRGKSAPKRKVKVDKIQSILDAIDRFEKKVDSLEKKLDSLEKKVDNLQTDFSEALPLLEKTGAVHELFARHYFDQNWGSYYDISDRNLRMLSHLCIPDSQSLGQLGYEDVDESNADDPHFSNTEVLAQAALDHLPELDA
jgi:hypothetical protein